MKSSHGLHFQSISEAVVSITQSSKGKMYNGGKDGSQFLLNTHVHKQLETQQTTFAVLKKKDIF